MYALDDWIYALCDTKHSENVNTISVWSGFVHFIEAGVVMNIDGFSVCAAGNSKHAASPYHGRYICWIFFPSWKF